MSSVVDVDSMVRRLKGFVDIPSVTADGEACGRAASLLEGMMREFGLEVRTIGAAGSNPVVIGELSRAGAARTLLVYGHYDVQPAGDAGAWSTPPFELSTRGGRLVGRGVVDNKGGIVAVLEALRMVPRQELRCNLVFLFEGEEEVGSPNFSTLLGPVGRAMDAVLSVDGETGALRVPPVVLGNKGIIVLDVMVKRAGRPIHSSYAAVSRNAAWDLLRAVLKVYDPGSGEIRFEMPRPTIPEPDPSWFDGIEADLGAEPGAARKARALTMGPTCTLQRLDSGYHGPGFITMIPSEALARIEFRLVPGQSPEEVLELTRRAMGDDDGVDVSVVSSAPAVAGPFGELARCVRETVLDVYRAEPPVYPMSPGTGPGLALREAFGAYPVLTGIATPPTNIHGPDEGIHVDDLAIGARFYAGILSRYGR